MKSIFSLILQSLLVIAGVLLFSYFDPFGILAPKKKTLQDTPVSVESIKEIGQLVTAEYYGEVLSSLHETFIDEVNNVQFKNKVDTLNLKYIKALTDFKDGKDTIQIKVRWYRKRKDLVDYFHSSYPELSNHPFYQKMLAIIIEKANRLKYSYDNEGDILKAIWKNEKIDPTIFNLTPAEIENSFRKEEEELKTTKAYKKRQIIAIGRGWVKAGLDFGNFNERNFKYDKAHNTIYLFGIDAKILDYDINPWFNAKAKIKGFEIIAATNQANRADYLEQVKESCLIKLKTQAENSGIVKQAQANAIETLKNFFSLLIGSPIDRVVISKSSPEEYLNDLAQKKLIAKDQLIRIDSLLLSLDSIDSNLADSAVLKILRLKFVSGLDTLLVKRYSALSYSVSEDKLITSEENEKLERVFEDENFSKLDSIWFFSHSLRDSVKRKSAQQADSITKYENTGTKRWYDSVTNDPSFKKYADSLISFKRSIIQSALKNRKSKAIAEAKSFLRKNVLQIQQVEKKSFTRRSEVDSLINRY